MRNKYATIYIKGNNKGVVVTIEIAEQIKDAKKRGIDGWLDFDGWSGNISEIKHIFDGVDEANRENYKEQLKEESREQSDKDYERVNSEYKAEIKKYKNGDIKTKLEYNLKLASFICYSMTGKWLKDWVKENNIQDLNEILIEELKKESLVVNPSHYKKLFVFTDTKVDSEKFARHAAIRLVDRQISEALETLKYIK